jgi:hypothetical protein
MAVSVATEHTARGWWLQEAEPTTELPPLEGELAADLVVVGGGYTGMWTAWFVSELEWSCWRRSVAARGRAGATAAS